MTTWITGPLRWRHAALAAGIVLGLVAAFLLGRASGARDVERPGVVDIGFSQDMATHHQQALLMSNLAADRAGPAVKALANAILVGQSQELGAMHGWLRLWGQPAESSRPMWWMSDAEHPPGDMADPSAHPGMPAESMPSPATMPGMASPDELLSLWGKSAHDFDVLFLQLMIRHHQGGIDMARYAQAHATLDLVREAARAMQVDQSEDIAEMLALLKTYGATPLPPP